MTKARLGNVLYWIGCIVAGIIVAAGAFETALGAFPSPWYFLFLFFIAAIIWFTGWTFHYFYSRL
jgi:hypothetical protein